MKIALGADHAGYDLKEIIKPVVELAGHEVKDFGTYSSDSTDYPDFAHPVASAVEKGEYKLGILICGTGNGVAITANKHQGIRAGLCWNKEVAALVKQHNNANILCLPGRFIEEEEAKAAVTVFLTTDFEGGRHARRIGKIPC
ncbi:MAG: ribose 5-phosphate isomerase B [Bacteroidota bacterium]